jgi:hypothetical protein
LPLAGASISGMMTTITARGCALFVSSLLCALLSTSFGAAQTFEEAITSGRLLIDARLRFESLQQDDKEKDAAATTIRARLGYETGTFRGFNGLVEVDLLGHVGERRFSDTVHVLPEYPTIPDPDMAVLNRLQLATPRG